MAATLHPNRATALAALWWLFEGATFYVYFADTTGASPQPSYTYTDYDDFYDEWGPYLLDSAFDQLIVGGSVAYDGSNTQLARLPQLEIVLDYPTAITYTHVIIELVPAVDPGASAPSKAFPIMLHVAESPAVTVASTATKTYTLDLTALFSS